MSEYEYGVSWHGRDMDDPHRTKMTQQEAEDWVREGEEMGFAKGAFMVIRRPVGEWEVAFELPFLTGNAWDYTRLYWGHNMSLKWDDKKKHYRGHIFNDKPVQEGDVVVTDESWMYVVWSECVGDPHDMYRVELKVFSDEARELVKEHIK